MNERTRNGFENGFIILQAGVWPREIIDRIISKHLTTALSRSSAKLKIQYSNFKLELNYTTSNYNRWRRHMTHDDRFDPMHYNAALSYFHCNALSDFLCVSFIFQLKKFTWVEWINSAATLKPWSEFCSANKSFLFPSKQSYSKAYFDSHRKCDFACQTIDAWRWLSYEIAKLQYLMLQTKIAHKQRLAQYNETTSKNSDIWWQLVYDVYSSYLVFLSEMNLAKLTAWNCKIMAKCS